MFKFQRGEVKLKVWQGKEIFPRGLALPVWVGKFIGRERREILEHGDTVLGGWDSWDPSVMQKLLTNWDVPKALGGTSPKLQTDACLRGDNEIRSINCIQSL